MEKKTFIKSVVIRTSPPLEKIDECITYAEGLWAGLSKRDYGGVSTQEESSVKAYEKLDDDKRFLFDRFWAAFGKHGNKQGGAKSWSELAPDDELAELIIKAAEMELQARPEIEKSHTPIQAQGWLSQNRYEKYIDKIQAKEKIKAKENTGSTGQELAHALNMIENGADINGTWQATVDRLTKPQS